MMVPIKLPVSSIRNFLLISLILLVAIAGSITAVLSYTETKEEVEELFDAELAQMARILQSLFVPIIHLENSENTKISTALVYKTYTSFKQDKAQEQKHRQSTDDDEESEYYTSKGHKYEQKLAFAVVNQKGQILLASNPNTTWDFSLINDGYSSLKLGKRLWRMFVLHDSDTNVRIFVGQRQAIRDGMIKEIGLSTLMIPLGLTPIIAVLVWLLVGYGLLPIKQISKELKHRNYSNLNPVDDEGLPKELKVLVDAINELFHRVLASAEREQRFTADAAHELRTPLAGTKIQLQNALRMAESSDIQHSIKKSLIGIQRLTDMVEQLLMLSRLDHEKTLQDMETLNLQELLQEIAIDLEDLLEQKQLTLDWQETALAVCRGNRGAIRVLLRNLLENAVRYTSEKTVITIKLEQHGISVIDQGPGVPEGQLDRLAERFFRVTGSGVKGSGLGLAIAQQIAEIHNGKLLLANRNDGQTGLIASYCFK
jgi:two-component system sensor histidine kinase QseC